MPESHTRLVFNAPSPDELAPLFPGYEIQALIATGGMGAVYRAVQKSLDRNVALKILPVEFSEDAEFCASFEAEAKAMARLNHPNLIGVYDFGSAEGMLYIVMEFVAGQSLSHTVHGHMMAPSEAIRLASAICGGLAHAHYNHIVHRDIKPSNILIDQEGQPKIGDFGLAHPLGRKVQDSDTIYGTPGYTAPEVLEAPDSVDQRADVFSVGVLLHELLTGKMPSEDQRPASVICGCDPRFDTIIRKATMPAPAARYSDIGELARDLKEIAKSPAPAKGTAASQAKKRAAHKASPLVQSAPKAGPASLRPPPPRPVAKAPKRTESGPWLALAGFLIIGALGIFAYVALSGPDKKEPPAATPPAPVKPAPKTTTPATGANDPQLPNVQTVFPLIGQEMVYDPTDVASLGGKLKERVTVKGMPVDLRFEGSTTIFLNFGSNEETSLTLVFLVKDSPTEFTSDKLRAFVGKKIQFNGLLYETDGKLRMRIGKLSEIKVLGGSGAQDEPKEEEKTESR